MKKYLLGLLACLVLAVIGSHWIGEPSVKTAEAAKPEEKPKENPLQIPPEKRAAAGITLKKPAEISLTPEIRAYGRALDPAPLATLVAEQETARTALSVSEKELGRVKKLFDAGGNATAQALETAEAAVLRDRAALASTRARLLAAWGPALSAVADLRFITEALEQGRSWIRIDLLPGESAANAKHARVGLLGSKEFFDAEILGPAPAADPQIQGASFLAIVREHAFPPGAALQGMLAGVGEAQAALTVPRSAVVYHQGSAWIYVLGEDNIFERKIVTVGRTLGNDVALLSGVEADEQVVVTGAQQVLAAELQAGGAPEEG
jgi:hypothetical protein